MLYPTELRAARDLHWFAAGLPPAYNSIAIGRGGEIRTPDPLLPKQMRYQAALHPVVGTVNLQL